MFILKLITTNEMYSASQPFEHVTWVTERIDGEAESHYHYKHADNSKRDLSPSIIWEKWKVNRIHICNSFDHYAIRFSNLFNFSKIDNRFLYIL